MSIDIAKIVNEPIFFERNRVGRVYTGGALYADFFGDDGTDGYLPEEWMASAVRALNKGSVDPKEGVSRVRGTDIYFDDLLASHKSELIGERSGLSLLVKMLDSAIRLPVQAHPNKAFSRKYFDSDDGKAECWIVIGVRPGAKVYLGFSEKVSPQRFEEAIEASKEKNADLFSSFLNEYTVKPGDCFFIPARIIHAIGPGCLILEVQEPTDFTISPEYWCGEYEQSPDEMYLGLEKDVAVSVFDFEAYGKNILESNRLVPIVVRDDNGVRRENIVGNHITDCFGLNKLTVNGGDALLEAAPAIYAVTDGSGELCGESYHKTLSKGDYFFLPVAANGKFSIKSGEYIEVYECLPPL
jgi:mannose-6-phosphate isomerase